VVLMEVSLSFLYHKFATASQTAILLRNPSPVCVYVCVSTRACGWVWVCAGMRVPFRMYPGVGHILLDCPRLIRHERLF